MGTKNSPRNQWKVNQWSAKVSVENSVTAMAESNEQHAAQSFDEPSPARKAGLFYKLVVPSILQDKKLVMSHCCYRLYFVLFLFESCFDFSSANGKMN